MNRRSILHATLALGAAAAFAPERFAPVRQAAAAKQNASPEAVAELFDDSVARLDPSKIKPMIEAATRARSSDSSTRRDDRVEEPRVPYVY